MTKSNIHLWITFHSVFGRTMHEFSEMSYEFSEESSYNFKIDFIHTDNFCLIMCSFE